MNLVPLFVAIPLGSAFLISLLGKRLRRFPDVLSVLATLSLSSISVLVIHSLRTEHIMVYKVGSWIPPIGISMVVDSLSAFILVAVNVVALLVTIYSTQYMETYTGKPKFYTLFLLMLAGMNGVTVTGDMFNLYVFLEIASIASYALVAFGTEHEELEASFRYMVMGILGSTLILLGIVFLYSLTSTLNMADMSRVLAEKLSTFGSSAVGMFVAALLIVGFGLKAAIVPFHWWLPDAHPSAPAPISAMLSGVLIKVLGVYALVRIMFNVFGITPLFSNILMILGALSIVTGSILAIGQEDMKRLLAYSSISQVGYILLGIGLGTPLGILGGLFHLLNHSVFKSLLFLNSGAVVYATGTRELEKMGGLNKKMPVTGGSSFIASMSIAGMPPFSGFWSKLVIILACIYAGRMGYAIWAVVGGIITLGYYVRLQKEAFFGSLKQGLSHVKEVPFAMKFSMVTLALICTVGGLVLIPSVSELFLKTAADVLLQGREYAAMVFGCVR